jgi:hypothetical protein
VHSTRYGRRRKLLKTCLRPYDQIETIHQMGRVVHLTHIRGHCITFWPSVPPLQVAPSSSCSSASLSRFPGHQMPGFHSLRHVILADYLLGQGGPSTCVTGHDMLQNTPSSNPPLGNRRLDTPSERSIGKRIYLRRCLLLTRAMERGPLQKPTTP